MFDSLILLLYVFRCRKTSGCLLIKLGFMYSEWMEEITSINEGYKLINRKCKLEIKEEDNIIINGNKALSLGAVIIRTIFD